MELYRFIKEEHEFRLDLSAQWLPFVMTGEGVPLVTAPDSLPFAAPLKSVRYP